MPDPLIILAPARSFTTVIGTMLGQHPEMFSVPEVNLFVVETMRERQGILKKPSRHTGLVRAVAQLWAGRQTIETCLRGQRWVELRLDRTCVSVMRELVDKVGERILVEKSPSTVRHVSCMLRARRAFPQARFIHLLRHPRSHGKSMVEFTGSRPTQAAPELVAQVAGDFSTYPPTIDAQKVWFTAHNEIVTFVDALPADKWMRVRGEALLTDPDKHLPVIAEWLGLRTDRDAVEAMKHPERSPFAGFGPINAGGGGDGGFFRNPVLRPFRDDPSITLEGPVPWRKDGKGFTPEVVQLASEFGYA